MTRRTEKPKKPAEPKLVYMCNACRKPLAHPTEMKAVDGLVYHEKCAPAAAAPDEVFVLPRDDRQMRIGSANAVIRCPTCGTAKTGNRCDVCGHQERDT